MTQSHLETLSFSDCLITTTLYHNHSSVTINLQYNHSLVTVNLQYALHSSMLTFTFQYSLVIIDSRFYPTTNFNNPWLTQTITEILRYLFSSYGSEFALLVSV